MGAGRFRVARRRCREAYDLPQRGFLLVSGVLALLVDGIIFFPQPFYSKKGTVITTFVVSPYNNQHSSVRKLSLLLWVINSYCCRLFSTKLDYWVLIDTATTTNIPPWILWYRARCARNLQRLTKKKRS